MRLGTELAYGPDMGSLVSAEQLARVEAHVEDARAKGARVLTGGHSRPDVGPYVYEPTVLAGVTAAMDVRDEETFGPVVTIYRVGSDEEAIAAGQRHRLRAQRLGVHPGRAPRPADRRRHPRRHRQHQRGLRCGLGQRRGTRWAA